VTPAVCQSRQARPNVARFPRAHPLCPTLTGITKPEPALSEILRSFLSLRMTERDGLRITSTEGARNDMGSDGLGI
jgi:hypothetical protein